MSGGGGKTRWYWARRWLVLDLWNHTTWTVAEIADFMGLTPATIRDYIESETEEDENADGQAGDAISGTEAHAVG